MKDAYYFSHDSNAHKDPKILKLRSKYGWEGYGIFWAIIETLREQDDYCWPADEKELICYTFANGDAITMQVLSYCIEIGLLIEADGFIYSESLNNRMKIKEEKRQKKVDAGRKGAESRWKNSSANGSVNGTPMAKNGKGKEKKVKESKEIIKEFEDVWSEYPKKVDKQDALKKFKTKAKQDGIEEVVNGTRKYIQQINRHGTDKQFVKNYATFLNKESYKDDFEDQTQEHNGGRIIKKFDLNNLFGESNTS